MYAKLLLNERVLDHVATFKERMRRINQGTQKYYNYNTNTREVTDLKIPGGTAITADHFFGTHKVPNGAVSDPKGPGLWTWLQIRGKDTVHTRFILAYKPCHTQSPGSTWTQKVNYFYKEFISKPNPCIIFDKQLTEAIQEWADEGDNIALGIDKNKDVGTSKLASLL